VRRILVVALLCVTVSARADDEKPELQRMRFIERGAVLTANGNISKLFDSSAYEELRSGFASTIVINTVVYRRDDSTPVSTRYEVRSVVYDLWDEQYVIRIKGPSGDRTRKVKYQAEALKVVTGLDDLPIAALSQIPHEDIFYLEVTVLLNPVSRETQAEVRRWLSQGTGGGLDRGGVFFGSFVSVFVNPKIAEADRVLRIRSQPFYRPRP
jgi:hypothetical protein